MWGIRCCPRSVQNQSDDDYLVMKTNAPGMNYNSCDIGMDIGKESANDIAKISSADDGADGDTSSESEKSDVVITVAKGDDPHTAIITIEQLDVDKMDSAHATADAVNAGDQEEAGTGEFVTKNDTGDGNETNIEADKEEDHSKDSFSPRASYIARAYAGTPRSQGVTPTSQGFTPRASDTPRSSIIRKAYGGMDGTPRADYSSVTQLGGDTPRNSQVGITPRSSNKLRKDNDWMKRVVEDSDDDQNSKPKNNPRETPRSNASTARNSATETPRTSTSSFFNYNTQGGSHRGSEAFKAASSSETDHDGLNHGRGSENVKEVEEGKKTANDCDDLHFAWKRRTLNQKSLSQKSGTTLGNDRADSACFMVAGENDREKKIISSLSSCITVLECRLEIEKALKEGEELVRKLATANRIKRRDLELQVCMQQGAIGLGLEYIQKNFKAKSYLKVFWSGITEEEKIDEDSDEDKVVIAVINGDEVDEKKEADQKKSDEKEDEVDEKKEADQKKSDEKEDAKTAEEQDVKDIIHEEKKDGDKTTTEKNDDDIQDKKDDKNDATEDEKKEDKTAEQNDVKDEKKEEETNIEKINLEERINAFCDVELENDVNIKDERKKRLRKLVVNQMALAMS